MICLLDEDAAECAKALDDKSLDKQIDSIAQTLCHVHYIIGFHALRGNNHSVLLLPEFYNDEYTNWARECVANYKKLVDIGLACCDEYNLRYNPGATYLFGTIEEQKEKVVVMQGLTIKKHKHHAVIEWARDNVPDLP